MGIDEPFFNKWGCHLHRRVWSNGCKVLGPWAFEPIHLFVPCFSWFWPACFGTRFWSGSHSSPIRWPDFVSSPQSDIGYLRILSSIELIVRRKRPFEAVSPWNCSPYWRMWSLRNRVLEAVFWYDEIEDLEKSTTFFFIDCDVWQEVHFIYLLLYIPCTWPGPLCWPLMGDS